MKKVNATFDFSKMIIGDKVIVLASSSISESFILSYLKKNVTVNDFADVDYFYNHMLELFEICLKKSLDSEYKKQFFKDNSFQDIFDKLINCKDYRDPNDILSEIEDCLELSDDPKKCNKTVSKRIESLYGVSAKLITKDINKIIINPSKYLKKYSESTPANKVDVTPWKRQIENQEKKEENEFFLYCKKIGMKEKEIEEAWKVFKTFIHPIAAAKTYLGKFKISLNEVKLWFKEASRVNDDCFPEKFLLKGINFSKYTSFKTKFKLSGHELYLFLQKKKII